VKAGLTLLVVLALGALAANFLLQDNGYVLINFRGYIIEMSVPVLIFLSILTYLLVRFLVRLWRAPRQLGEAAARRRVRKAGERITQGYIEIGQGNFARGEKLLTKGARNSETPLLNYLEAARAAQAQGDTERRDVWLTMASEQEPRARETVLLTKAQLQQEAEDTDGALQTLQEVLQTSPRNPEALRIEAEIQVSRDNWQALEQLLPQLRKLGKMSVTTLDEWTTRTWSVLLSHAGSDKTRGKQLWKALPRSLREVPELVIARAQSLLSAGEGRQAESLLRAALKLAWHDDLILAYGALEQPSAADSLKRVEQWLPSRSEDPILLLVAARLCMATELWGKARSYYESSAALRPEPQTWYELGQLLLQLGEQQQAFSIFQKSLTPGHGAAEVPRLPDARMDDGQPAA